MGINVNLYHKLQWFNIVSVKLTSPHLRSIQVKFESSECEINSSGSKPASLVFYNNVTNTPVRIK